MSTDRSEPPALSSEVRALAKSPHPPDRAEAGRRLATFAGRSDVDDLLLHLVLDENDTLVTFETAKALLARGDTASARVIARAAALVDPRDSTSDWLSDAVNDVWLQNTDDARTALGVCSALADDPEAAVREGAIELRLWIESDHRPVRSNDSKELPGSRWLSGVWRRLGSQRPDVP